MKITYKSFFKELANAITEEVDAVHQPPAVKQSGKYTQDFIVYMKKVENEQKAGYISKTDLWFPYKSLEKGTNKTIAWGHRLTDSEMANNTFVRGLTTKEANQLLIKDLDEAKEKVFRYHERWKRKYIENLQKAAMANPNSPSSKFAMNLKPTDPMFKLTQKQLEMVVEYAFNTGGLTKFPKFSDAVFRKDWATAIKEHKRTYTDNNGIKHELSRNKYFYEWAFSQV